MSQAQNLNMAIMAGIKSLTGFFLAQNEAFCGTVLIMCTHPRVPVLSGLNWLKQTPFYKQHI